MKTGVVLLNLGGPDSLDAVKPFLFNLFSDREIIPLGPKFLQRPLAWIISTFRAPKTRKAYSLIGGNSPILKITTEQASALQKELREIGDIPVYVGMRYWHPFIEESVRRASEEGCKRLIGLSLYPHYSRATTYSAVSVFKKTCIKERLEYLSIESWHDHPLYIEAVVERIKEKIDHDKDTLILFSAHSLPVKFIDEGDPYLDEIKVTVELVMERLTKEFGTLPYRVGFQSRSGPVRWLEPSTDEVIVKASEEGVKNILVVPISFVSDHIETLYEIDILYRELAAKHGVELKRVNSLNTSPLFIATLKELVLEAYKKI
jgi:ferrochelatase